MLVERRHGTEDRRVAFVGAGTGGRVLDKFVEQRAGESGQDHLQGGPKRLASIHIGKHQYQHIPEYTIAQSANESKTVLDKLVLIGAIEALAEQGVPMLDPVQIVYYFLHNVVSSIISDKLTVAGVGR